MNEPFGNSEQLQGDAGSRGEVLALAKLVGAAGLMLAEIDTCGHDVDQGYRSTLYDAWKDGQAALPELQAAQPASSAGGQEAAYPDGGDREVLRYLMQQFDAESWQCPQCGHAEDTATMDSADYLRRYLAAQPQAEQQGAGDAPYSLDADPAGIRARVADCITGTMMVGAQNHTPPPAGHWLVPFWEMARAEAEKQPAPAAVPVDVRTLLAAEFDKDEVTAAAARRLRNHNETAVEAAAMRAMQALATHPQPAVAEDGSREERYMRDALNAYPRAAKDGDA